MIEIVDDEPVFETALPKSQAPSIRRRQPYGARFIRQLPVRSGALQSHPGARAGCHQRHDVAARPLGDAVGYLRVSHLLKK